MDLARRTIRETERGSASPLQLCYYMEQVGCDGKPRPESQRTEIDNAKWPEGWKGAAIRIWKHRFWGRCVKELAENGAPL